MNLKNEENLRGTLTDSNVYSSTREFWETVNWMAPTDHNKVTSQIQPITAVICKSVSYRVTSIKIREPPRIFVKVVETWRRMYMSHSWKQDVFGKGRRARIETSMIKSKSFWRRKTGLAVHLEGKDLAERINKFTSRRIWGGKLQRLIMKLNQRLRRQVQLKVRSKY